MKILEGIFTLVVGALVIVAALLFVAVLIGFPVMWLWNWLVPTLFGLPTITFWQAVGLHFLIGLVCCSSSTSTKTKK